MNDAKEYFNAREITDMKIEGFPTTVQGILRKAKKENWPFRSKENVKGLEYHFSCLPAPVRIKLMSKKLLKTQDVTVPTANERLPYTREAIWSYWERATQAKRDKAMKRVEATILLSDLIQTGEPVMSAFDSVVKEKGVTLAALKTWYYRTKRFERDDWPALLINKLGFTPVVSSRNNKVITDEAWDFFCADYLRLEAPSFNACYRRLEAAAQKHGWEILTPSGMRERLKKRVKAENIVLLREGEHAAMRLYPPQERTVSNILATEWLNGDGYKHNVFVRLENGKIIRPVTWFWQDVHSRKMLGYRTDVSENTDSLRLSFLDVITQYGFPKDVTIDNTRAAANKWMTGGAPGRHRFKDMDDQPLGLLPMLGIRIHWTSIISGRGHGQAKPVERAFGVGGLGELVDKHPLLAGAYTGPNPMEKPDNYGEKAVSVDVFLKALEEGVNSFNSQRKRNTEACYSELSFNEAFEISYANAVVTKPTKGQRVMFLLPSELVTVTNGCFYLNAGGRIGGRRNRYFSQMLLSGGHKKIVVRFDPQSMHEPAHCYTPDGRFISMAECIEKVAFGDTQAAREHSRNRKEFVASVKKAAAAEKRMKLEEMQELMNKPEAATVPEPKVVGMFRGNVQKVNQPAPLISEEQSQKNQTAFRRAVNAAYAEFKEQQL